MSQTIEKQAFEERQKHFANAIKEFVAVRVDG